MLNELLLAAADYVFVLELEQLGTRVDLGRVVGILFNLSVLQVTYGVKKVS